MASQVAPLRDRIGCSVPGMIWPGDGQHIFSGGHYIYAQNTKLLSHSLDFYCGSLYRRDRLPGNIVVEFPVKFYRYLAQICRQFNLTTLVLLFQELIYDVSKFSVIFSKQAEQSTAANALQALRKVFFPIPGQFFLDLRNKVF
jgi:hypothetical protein